MSNRRPAPIAIALAVLSLTFGGRVASARQQQPQAPAVTLHIGDTAPELKVGKWVKGEPVERLAPGTIYVIECWATWCGPCRASIPHVTELQKKYEGKVVFVGVDVWEQDEAGVEPFVKEMGEKMGYRVALDDKTEVPKEGEPSGATARNWLGAAGQNGIPCSFVVNGEGKLAWAGHPMALDGVLEKVVAGTYDLNAAKAAAMGEEERAKLAEANNAKMQSAMTAVDAAVAKGDAEGALRAVDQLGTDIPSYAKRLDAVKFQVLLLKLKRYDQAYEMADKALESAKDDAGTLAAIAGAIAMGPGVERRDLKVAERFAERAVQVTQQKDLEAMGLLGAVYVAEGKTDKAEGLAGKEKPDVVLNSIAWAVVTASPDAKPDLDAAVKLATKAVELNGRQDGQSLDTLARAYFLKGDVDKAIELETEAVGKAPEAEKGQLQATLEEYRKAKK